LFRVRAETTDTRPRAPRPEPAGGERVQLRRRYARFRLFEAVLLRVESLDLRPPCLSQRVKLKDGEPPLGATWTVCAAGLVVPTYM